MAVKTYKIIFPGGLPGLGAEAGCEFEADDERDDIRILETLGHIEATKAASRPKPSEPPPQQPKPSEPPPEPPKPLTTQTAPQIVEASGSAVGTTRYRRKDMRATE